MNVSRSSHYDWLHRSPATTEKNDQALTKILVEAFKKSRATYGTRRLKKVLFQQDRMVSRRRIGRLMRDAKLACTQGGINKTRRRFKATTNSKHNLPVADNHLNRHKQCSGRTRPMWATSLTSIPRKVGCIWQWSSICFPGKSSVGQWLGIYPRGTSANQASK